MLARIDFDKNYNMEVPGEDSTKGWCNIIVGRYLFTFIGISIKFVAAKTKSLDSQIFG